MSTNRVLHKDADSITYLDRTFCLYCLYHFDLAVNPDAGHHEYVYHQRVPALMFAAARRVRGEMMGDV